MKISLNFTVISWTPVEKLRFVQIKLLIRWTVNLSGTKISIHADHRRVLSFPWCRSVLLWLLPTFTECLEVLPRRPVDAQLFAIFVLHPVRFCGHNTRMKCTLGFCLKTDCPLIEWGVDEIIPVWLHHGLLLVHFIFVDSASTCLSFFIWSQVICCLWSFRSMMTLHLLMAV